LSYRHVVLKEAVEKNVMMPLDIATAEDIDYYNSWPLRRSLNRVRGPGRPGLGKEKSVFQPIVFY
jgi:hypothetical protein